MRQLVSLASQKMTIPVLNTILVKNNIATAHDLECLIQHPADGIRESLYKAPGFDNSDLRAASDIDPGDFPDSILMGEHLGTLEMEVSKLIFVSHTMSTEETRYYLNGICFFHDALVSTDGHRLNLAKIKEGTLAHDKFKGGLIVPRHSLKYIIAAAKEKKAKTLTLDFFEHAVKVQIGDYTIFTKYVDGTFPDYQRVIPQIGKNTRQTRFLVSQFELILPTVKTLTKQKGGKIPAISLYNGMVFCGDHHRWPVTANFDITIGFDLSLLVKAVSGDCYYTDAHTPLLIKNDHLGYLSVVMPMRV